MFTDYFTRQSGELLDTLRRNLEEKGLGLPAKEKDLSVYNEFYTFLKDHLPDQYSLATGKVRGKKHILNRNCDVLIYNKWCPKALEMAGGYVLIDTLHAFMSLETDLKTAGVMTHAAMTNALKSLYQSGNPNAESPVVPMFSVLFAYDSAVPLLSHKVAIRDISREKEISVSNEMDMICVLNQGLIIKDWENGGDYKVVETGPDTLLWFFILFLEYIDQEGRVNLDLRDFIKNTKQYKEY